MENKNLHDCNLAMNKNKGSKLINPGALDFEKFHIAINDEERVSIVYNMLKELSLRRDEKPVYECHEKKSIEKCLEFRSAANNCFITNPKEALSLYTKSICFAPYPLSDTIDSRELAISFAHRSGLLFSIAKYKACLQDIRKALTFNYPEDRKQKLLDRQFLCQAHLNSMEGPKHSFQTLAGFLPPPSRDQTPCFQGDSVIEKFTDAKGRFVEATKDIEAGEYVIIEKPYASVLWPEHYITHCYHCKGRMIAMIPCKHCTKVMYCTDLCRTLSWVESHHIECRLIPFLIQFGSATTLLMAVNMLLVSISRSGGFRQLYQEANAVEGGQTSGSTDQYKYANISHLFAENSEDKDFTTLWEFATASGYVLEALVANTDFVLVNIDDNSNDTDCVDLVTFAGGFLMKAIQLRQSYGVVLRDLLSGDKFQNVEYYFGHGMYPVINSLRHSCAPNVTSGFKRDVCILMATRPIKKGEEILISYDTAFQERKREDRREILQAKYSFNCKCDACFNDWPLYEKLSDVPPFLCCKCKSRLPYVLGNLSKRLRCLKCNKKNDIRLMEQNLHEAHQKLKAIFRELASTSTKDFTQELVALMNVFLFNLEYPNRLAIKCEDALKINFLQMGNYFLSN